MLTPEELKDLKEHLQTAIDVELSTIPIYLYTYYSVRRKPDLYALDPDRIDPIATFTNKTGSVIMSVAVEEMLHVALVGNILKALGGSPKMYGRSPKHFPTNLSHHNKGFTISLSKLSEDQLKKFMEIEQPAPSVHAPQGDNWDTLGQFYEYIEDLIDRTGAENYSNADYQLAGDKGYYSSSNVDTIYPEEAYERASETTHFANSDNTGGLLLIKSREDAKAALKEITEQGEGYAADPNHKFADAGKEEESHWYKFKELLEDFRHLELLEDEFDAIVYEFPDNPVKEDYPEKYWDLTVLFDAIYAYMLLMIEVSFTLKGSAQFSLFYVGMHRSMIFIMDKLIGKMRGVLFPDKAGNLCCLAPCFGHHRFESIETAKKEMVELAEKVFSIEDLNLGHHILHCIKELPDVHVVDNKVKFS